MPRKTYYLDSDFGLSPSKSQTLLSADFATPDAVAKQFPKYYQRMTTKGPFGLGRPLTPTEVLSTSWIDAAWSEAKWQGQGGGQPIETGYMSSGNHVVVPQGTYYHTIPLEFSSGEYEMQGPGYTEAGNDTINTKLAVYHEKWMGHPAIRHTLVSGSWGVSGNVGYVEGTRFHNFRLDGRQESAPGVSFESNGLMAWKPGELTDSGRIWAEGYRNRGVVIFGPTPTKLGNFTTFSNVIAGLSFFGSWGGTVDMDLLSGDNNGILLELAHFNGNTAGGSINIGAIKSETMVATSGRTWRGQIVAYLRGQFNVTIGALSAAVGGGRLPAVFVVDDRMTNGTPQQSSLVANMRGYYYQCIVHDVRRGRGFSSLNDFRGGLISYDTAEGRLIHLSALREVAPIDGLATFRVAHRVGGGGTAPLNMGPTAVPYREIVTGPPTYPAVTYLDSVGPTATGPTFGGSTGSTGGTSTGPTSGGTSTGPTGPTSGGTSTGPTGSTSGGAASVIPVQTVTVVVNTADPTSAPMASAYVQRWGIPNANIVAVNLGTADNLTSASVLQDARTQINSRNGEHVVLAFAAPLYYNTSQSITSAIQNGPRSVTLLTESPLYRYTGLRPRTDRGVPTVSLLRSSSYIRRDAHGTRPAGLSVLLLAKDSNSQGNPRGSARAAQRPSGVTVWDNRSLTNVGSGVNQCNYISNSCWISTRKITTPVVAGYQSLFQLGDDAGVVYAKGYYGDHVTSFGGILPHNGTVTRTNSASQTSLLYHLDRGACFSVGTVSEPYQSKTGYSAGSLVEQFVDTTVFHPLFVGGSPAGVAAWASVKCPDRAIFVGDPLCATFA